MSEATELTPQEKRVMMMILETLEGNIQGFPDTERKLRNVAKAWAKIVSFDQYHVQYPKGYEPTDDDKQRFSWKEGVVPAEWLIGQVRDSCEWLPAPVVVREMYCSAGFVPVDGVTIDQLPFAGRNRGDAQTE